MSAIRFCQICKEIISPERAEVIPATRLCSDHAQAVRKFGGEFKVYTTQETISKKGSLKKNYGGVSTLKQRNAEALDWLQAEYDAQQ